MPVGTTIGQILVEFRATTSRLRADLASASSLIRDWSLLATGMGGTITQAFMAIANVGMRAVQAGAIALVGSFTLMAVEGAKFQDEMVRTFTLLGKGMSLSEVVMEDLTNAARLLGRETLFSATQAAQGMQILARSGFNAREVVRSIRPVLDLAVVGNLEMAEAANYVVTALRGFQLNASEAARVADVMAIAMARSNTDVRMLGDALSYVAPVATGAGLTLEETAAAVGILSDAGIQGSRAGTSLRRMIAKLQAPTGAAKRIFRELGLQVKDTSGDLLPLIDILRNMEKSGISSSQAMESFGLRAGPGVQALLARGSGALLSLQRELENSGGAADRMSQKFRTTVKGRVLDLIASIKDLGLSFSRYFEEPLADVIFALRNFIKDVVEAGEESGLFKAIVEGIVNVLISLGGFIRENADGFKEFIEGLDVGEVIGFFKQLADTAKEWSDKLKDAFDKVGELFRGMFVGVSFDYIFEGLITALPAITTLLTLVWELIIQIGNAAIWVLNVWSKLPTGLKEAVGWVSKILAGVGLLSSALSPVILATITWKLAIIPIAGLIGKIAIILAVKILPVVFAIATGIATWNLAQTLSDLMPIERAFTKMFIHARAIGEIMKATVKGEWAKIPEIIGRTKLALREAEGVEPGKKWSDVLEPFKPGGTGASIGDLVMGAYEDAFEQMKDAGTFVGEKISSAFREGADYLKSELGLGEMGITDITKPVSTVAAAGIRETQRGIQWTGLPEEEPIYGARHRAIFERAIMGEVARPKSPISMSGRFWEGVRTEQEAALSEIERLSAETQEMNSRILETILSRERENNEATKRANDASRALDNTRSHE